jgi:hypothetical protein
MTREELWKHIFIHETGNGADTTKSAKFADKALEEYDRRWVKNQPENTQVLQEESKTDQDVKSAKEIVKEPEPVAKKNVQLPPDFQEYPPEDKQSTGTDIEGKKLYDGDNVLVWNDDGNETIERRIYKTKLKEWHSCYVNGMNKWTSEDKTFLWKYAKKADVVQGMEEISSDKAKESGELAAKLGKPRAVPEDFKNPYNRMIWLYGFDSKSKK